MKKVLTRKIGITRKGFTLLEMIIVVIIIGVLASIGMARYQRTVERARIGEAVGMLGIIRTAQYRFASARNRFTNDLDSLDLNVTASGGGKFFSFLAINTSNTPFDGVDKEVASATRNSNEGGCYGNCCGYIVYINESGNFSISGSGSDCSSVGNFL